MEILRRDGRIEVRLAKEQSPADISQSWFAASEIALNDDDLPDLVVQGVEPRLLGANLVPLWVFLQTPQGYELALSISTLGLEVLETKTGGYRDIRTRKATASEVLTTTYRVDGNKYQVHSSSREKIIE